MHNYIIHYISGYGQHIWTRLYSFQASATRTGQSGDRWGIQLSSVL